MSQTTLSPKIREFAHRLVAYEAIRDNPSGTNTLAGFRVSEKLRRSVSTVAGSGGFHSLLARALTLAKAEVPLLSAVNVKPDGSLEVLSELGNQDQAAEATVILIAQLLGLVVTFIGESLMLSLVLDAWPDFPVLDTLEEERL
jgi:hypothetical protein